MADRCDRIDKQAKLLHLEQTLDDRGQELFPARTETFDKLERCEEIITNIPEFRV